MLRSSYGSLQAFLYIALLLFAAGCGEDPRFSAKTQYLGGAYGNAPAGPAHDTVSYWDGDSTNGKPSITISLREQRAYFYKSGVLVGVSQLSTGREGLNTPYGHFSIIQQDVNHVSSLFGDYVDSAGKVVVPDTLLREKPLATVRGVGAVVRVLKPYKLAARDSRGASTVAIGGVQLGENEEVVLISGPCSVESRDQIFSIARTVKKSGAKILRGGAFKPRTSPYSFQGLREDGLRFLAEARAETGLPVITEIMDPRDLPVIEKYADCLQVGTRNMHNFSLLKEVGRSKLPVLLKRGFSATLNDLIMSAEYILSEGNMNVILCERGIRTFETAARYTLDLSAVPLLKSKTHLPVIVDPTHAIGLHEFVPQMSLAAVAAGADGLMIEVHDSPELAKSDGNQALTPEIFAGLVPRLRAVATAIGRAL